MGLYDRPYYRDEEPPRMALNPSTQSFAVIAIIANVALFFADFLFGGRDFALQRAMQVNPETIVQPWMYWKFLTYGFAHGNMNHLLFNMIGLFFFGRAVENRVGKFEFIRFYLVAIILGGIFWSVRTYFFGGPGGGVIGASGGVVAVTMLFVLWYPQAEILLMMVLPIKGWVLGLMLIVGNLLGMGSSQTAFDVHLVGIGFAISYFYFNWNLATLPFGSGIKIPRRGPRLKLHDPDRKARKETQEADEAERILQKIHDQGESSLTNAERKLLERYSRRLRERR
ncbi:MAG: rhomboid family intramembrane serine protease [Pirellulaceae bacterium]